jgi:hypothetical protein
MPKAKLPSRAIRRSKIRSLKTTTTIEDAEKVKGGKTPTPGGPVPIPYPTTG